jgi:hypothetical protein
MNAKLLSNILYEVALIQHLNNLFTDINALFLGGAHFYYVLALLDHTSLL